MPFFKIFLGVLVCSTSFAGEDYTKQINSNTRRQAVLEVGHCVQMEEFNMAYDRYMPVIKVNVRSCLEKVSYQQSCKSINWWPDKCTKIEGSEEYSSAERTYTKSFRPSYFEADRSTTRLPRNRNNTIIEELTTAATEEFLNSMGNQRIQSNLRAQCELFVQRSVSEAQRNGGACPF